MSGAEPIPPAGRAVHTEAAPPPAGAYTRAVRAGDLVFLAGRTPRRTNWERTTTEPFAAQARQVMDNLEAVAKAAGGSLHDAVKVTVYLCNPDRVELTPPLAVTRGGYPAGAGRRTGRADRSPVTGPCLLCDRSVTAAGTGRTCWLPTGMHKDINPRRTRPLSRRRHRRTALAALLAATAVTGAALTGCGAGDSKGNTAKTDDDARTTQTGKKVLWLGDSIAAAEAPPLEAALKASGVEFKNASSDGGGTIVEGDPMAGKIAEGTWKDLAKSIDSFRPNVIAYQITTYDWGSAEQQRASYEKLAKTVQDAGAELVIVSAPPFKIDDFYKKYEGAIASAPKAAKEVADHSNGKVRFVDSSALWGTEAGAGKAQRASDGIHSCQQGSAAFAAWFTKQIGTAYGFTPAPADKWATGAWTADERYGKLSCR
ncbi:Rid family hydrolase [Streptomyces sp. x-80]|uniref:Rid family hydrolase n=1 Tax=Streptomyces sp. x-80 TaxID=2789282 RepID=UPI003980A488